MPFICPLPASALVRVASDISFARTAFSTLCSVCAVISSCPKFLKKFRDVPADIQPENYVRQNARAQESRDKGPVTIRFEMNEATDKG